MNDEIDNLEMKYRPTVAILDQDGSVLIRLLEFTGQRRDQPMGMFKTPTGNRIFYIHFTPDVAENSIYANRLLQKLCENYTRDVGELLELITWSDRLQGFWLTPILRVYYLGSVYMFEAKPKFGYIGLMFPAGLRPADHLRLRDYVSSDIHQVGLESDEVTGEGLIERLRINEQGEVVRVGLLDQDVDVLIVDVHPKIQQLSNDKLKGIIITESKRLGYRHVMLRNIYVANYMSSTLLTKGFYQSLDLLTNQKRTEVCQTV